MQIKWHGIEDYETSYRQKRQKLLGIACGVARTKFPHLKKVIGIAIDAPKYAIENSEDFVVLDAERWTKDDELYFQEANRDLGFFQSSGLQMTERRITDFPEPEPPAR